MRRGMIRKCGIFFAVSALLVLAGCGVSEKSAEKSLKDSAEILRYEYRWRDYDFVDAFYLDPEGIALDYDVFSSLGYIHEDDAFDYTLYYLGIGDLFEKDEIIEYVRENYTPAEVFPDD